MAPSHTVAADIHSRDDNMTTDRSAYIRELTDSRWAVGTRESNGLVVPSVVAAVELANTWATVANLRQIVVVSRTGAERVYC